MRPKFVESYVSGPWMPPNPNEFIRFWGRGWDRLDKLAAHQRSGCRLPAYASHQHCELPAGHVEGLRTSSAGCPELQRIDPPYAGSPGIELISIASCQQVLAAGRRTSSAGCPDLQHIDILCADCPGMLHISIASCQQVTLKVFGHRVHIARICSASTFGRPAARACFTSALRVARRATLKVARRATLKAAGHQEQAARFAAQRLSVCHRASHSCELRVASRSR